MAGKAVKHKTETRDIILQMALSNALAHKGKASQGAVLGMALSRKDMPRDVQAIMPVVEKAVRQVNAMPPEEQSRLGKTPEKKPPREGLPPLKGAEKGKVVTRFAPAPTGPLNLAQLLRAAMVSYLYSQKYDGRFVVRIEDTDPKSASKEYIGMIKQDLKAVCIGWDEYVIESDLMPEYYSKAEALISKGSMYVCTCPAEDFRQRKLKRQDCPCRSSDSMQRWKDMLSGEYGEGEAVARLKTSMSDPNPALRDPPMLRVCLHPHTLKGTRYKVWPLYNYAAAIADNGSGVTHVFRGKEHEHNTQVQLRLLKEMGLEPPSTVNFGMIYFRGGEEKVHTRDIRKGIEDGRISGWDAPGLHTIRSLLRRGFSPASFKKLAEEVGLTKTDIRLSWENLEGINRKIIDQDADRLFAVLEPFRLTLDKAPEKTELPVHPDLPARGMRRIRVSGQVYIPGESRGLKEMRLIGLGNYRLSGGKAKYAGDDRSMKPKLQWVSEGARPFTLVRPDRREEGLIEPAKLRKGQIVQLERIGFCRVDSIKPLTLFFAHK